MQRDNSFHRLSGLTLIELAITMLVMGILLQQAYRWLSKGMGTNAVIVRREQASGIVDQVLPLIRKEILQRNSTLGVQSVQLIPSQGAFVGSRTCNDIQIQQLDSSQQPWTVCVRTVCQGGSLSGASGGVAPLPGFSCPSKAAMGTIIVSHSPGQNQNGCGTPTFQQAFPGTPSLLISMGACFSSVNNGSGISVQIGASYPSQRNTYQFVRNEILVSLIDLPPDLQFFNRH